jgi:Family of unknown function (DUF6011)
MSIKCGHCGGRHEGLAEVKACSVRATRAGQPKPGPATEGMYRKDGEVYKVIIAVHGSGRLYAKRLVMATDGTGPVGYETARGMVHKLTQADRMTQLEAAAFGHLYGICVRCAATLTDENSIARGMGPVCATKI